MTPRTAVAIALSAVAACSGCHRRSDESHTLPDAAAPAVESPEDALKCPPLTISRAYWFDDPRRPADIPADAVPTDGTGHVLMHVDQHVEGVGPSQYSTFYETVDRGFVLRAPGQDDVPAVAERGMWTQEFYLRVARRDLEKMEPGVAYALAPLNRKGPCRWKIRDRVELMRSPTSR